MNHCEEVIVCVLALVENPTMGPVIFLVTVLALISRVQRFRSRTVELIVQPGY